MADPAKAFVSYSREDLDFVLRLCRDLRAAGAAIWLDKLDISPGQEWDQAVERGLSECGRMLLVLSPRSVASQNVLDEVGYALTKKKAIVPVLVQDCEIPYRLSRLQYVDARTDYDGAVRELLSALQGAKDAQAVPDASTADRSDGVGVPMRTVIVAAIVLAVIVVGLVVRNRTSPTAPPVEATTASAAPPAPTPTPAPDPAPPFREAFRAALQRFIDAAPTGFQSIGAKDFVDWTPSVEVPGATSCRGSGYPREPVVECVLYRTSSEVEAANKLEDAIDLVRASLPDWTGDRVNASRAVFTRAKASPIIGLGVTASGGRFDVELSVQPGSP